MAWRAADERSSRPLLCLALALCLLSLILKTVPAGRTATVADDPTLDLRIAVNSAGQSELEAVPGIGPVTARRILDRRTSLGKFTGPSDLLEVRGVGPAVLAGMRPYIGFEDQ